ncbi:MAG: N-acetylmuramoyl-L-alanine amidase [Mediterranea sp.]|jgi:N-acetyl-anhydromuramyl-L-alanine amidase AmpD|nr:N-acetylmuramoyl-L-alanine amidase [Mediterranea sp.]
MMEKRVDTLYTDGLPQSLQERGTVLPEREIRLLVVHCSATRPDADFGVDKLRATHLGRGFSDIGYHFYVTRDGRLHRCRPMGAVGAHARGYNLHSLGICYEGGLDSDGRPADTRTPAQRQRLRELIDHLRRLFPEARVVGHYQLGPDVHKACPCFDAEAEYSL